MSRFRVVCAEAVFMTLSLLMRHDLPPSHEVHAHAERRQLSTSMGY